MSDSAAKGSLQLPGPLGFHPLDHISFSFATPARLWGPYCADCMNIYASIGYFPSDAMFFVHCMFGGKALSIGDLVGVHGEATPFSLTATTLKAVVGGEEARPLNCSRVGCPNGSRLAAINRYQRIALNRGKVGSEEDCLDSPVSASCPTLCEEASKMVSEVRPLLNRHSDCSTNTSTGTQTDLLDFTPSLPSSGYDWNDIAAVRLSSCVAPPQLNTEVPMDQSKGFDFNTNNPPTLATPANVVPAVPLPNRLTTAIVAPLLDSAKEEEGVQLPANRQPPCSIISSEDPQSPPSTPTRSPSPSSPPPSTAPSSPSSPPPSPTPSSPSPSIPQSSLSNTCPFIRPASFINDGEKANVSSCLAHIQQLHAQCIQKHAINHLNAVLRARDFSGENCDTCGIPCVPSSLFFHAISKKHLARMKANPEFVFSYSFDYVRARDVLQEALQSHFNPPTPPFLSFPSTASMSMATVATSSSISLDPPSPPPSTTSSSAPSKATNLSKMCPFLRPASFINDSKKMDVDACLSHLSQLHSQLAASRAIPALNKVLYELEFSGRTCSTCVIPSCGLTSIFQHAISKGHISKMLADPEMVFNYTFDYVRARDVLLEALRNAGVTPATSTAGSNSINNNLVKVRPTDRKQIPPLMGSLKAKNDGKSSGGLNNNSNQKQYSFDKWSRSPANARSSSLSSNRHVETLRDSPMPFFEPPSLNW